MIYFEITYLLISFKFFFFGLYLVLESADHGQVVKGDVVVVIFNFRESSIMFSLHVINLLVLSLFSVANLKEGCKM